MPNRHPLNAICPYFTMFPLEFPVRVLGRHKDKKLVVDPFCGRGTTLYACRNKGVRAIGIDCSPVAVAISQAKLVAVSAKRCLSLLDRLLDGAPEPDLPEGPFWNLAFHKTTLTELCRLRTALLTDCSSNTSVLLRAAVLGCLHGPDTATGSYLSNQMQRTFSPKPGYAVRFWRERKLRPKCVSVRAALKRKLERLTKVVSSSEDGGWKDVVLGDASAAKSYNKVPSRVDLVITSPPYYGMRTYVPDQWLRNWFLGGPSHVDYSDEGRLPSSSPDMFAAALGQTWLNLANKSDGNLDLYVRFGVIPSRAIDSKKLLLQSLEQSRIRWRVVSIRSADTADAGKRQLSQMSRKSKPVAEFDLHAILL
jgi:hypothetical protein